MIEAEREIKCGRRSPREAKALGREVAEEGAGVQVA
jgi:predicted NAD-dependent protein-ADP-ribosyltransferase YbiA (DUF1768 family)